MNTMTGATEDDVSDDQAVPAALALDGIHPLPDGLLRAISDPGSVTQRAPGESLSHWQARAVVLAAAPALRAQGAATERERIRQLAVEADAWFMDAQPQPPSFGVVEVERPFADLLDGTP